MFADDQGNLARTGEYEEFRFQRLGKAALWNRLRANRVTDRPETVCTARERHEARGFRRP